MNFFVPSRLSVALFSAIVAYLVLCPPAAKNVI
jgi:hypothetical protein